MAFFHSSSQQPPEIAVTASINLSYHHHRAATVDNGIDNYHYFCDTGFIVDRSVPLLPSPIHSLPPLPPPTAATLPLM
jgi:hypothetical protein